MAATPNMIPSDLTLEIGDDPSPERFMAAARAFFGYVHEISRIVVPEGESLRWIVRVREGSALLGVDPAPGAVRNLVELTYRRAERGLRQLLEGNIKEAGLPESALKHLRSLSQLTNGNTDKPALVRLWVKHRPVVVNRQVARTIEEDWQTAYRDFGTLEGRLEVIEDRNGHLQLVIHDAAFHRRVRCFFPEAMLAQAFELFRKRVEVSGTIHYRKNGAPISIEVERIEKLPDDSELPSAQAVRGILKASA